MISFHRLSALVAAGVFALAAPSSANAQFGGLIKKAKEKVAEKGAETAADKAADKMSPVTPGEQLTDDLLSKVINGAQAADRMLGERDRVQAARETKNKEFSALLDKNQPVHSAYNEANSKIMDCRSSSFRSLDDARRAKYDARVKQLQADPAFMGKYQLISMKYAKQIAEAQQKQDPVALQKAQMDMMKEIVGSDVFADIKKDSVTTNSKCGKVPALPAALTQEEKMRTDIAAADDSIRTLEAKAVNAGAQASGLEQVRYLQLKERALSIMNRVAGQGAKAKFGDEETEAVKKRLSDLERVKRAL
jgi:hypothetical protein